MKKQKKMKILTAVFVSLFIISFLYSSTSVRAGETYQDDSDIDVTLHCRLLSDSSELVSSLMPTGFYNFYEIPQIDVGTFSHDLTFNEIEKLQYPISSSTNTNSYNITNLSGNQTKESSELPEYTLSAPKDTVLEIVIDYETNVSEFVHDDTFNVDFENPDVDCIRWDGSYWWILSNTTNKVYKYDTSFSYIGEEHYLGNEDIDLISMEHYGDYWYVLGSENDKIFLYYTSNWSYTEISYDVSGDDNDMHCIYHDGTYFYTIGYESTPTMYEYDSSFSLQRSDDITIVNDNNIVDVFFDTTYDYWYFLGVENSMVYCFNEGSGSDIIEYGWDLTNFTYEQNTPTSMDLYGSYLYISDSSNNRIYRYYSMEWFYVGVVGDLTSISGSAVDLWSDGTYWYYLAGSTIYVLDQNFGIISTNALGGSISGVRGFCFDGTYWLVASEQGSTDYIYRYTSGFSYVSRTTITQTEDIRDVEWDGSKYYVLDDTAFSTTYEVHKYSSAWVYETTIQIYVGFNGEDPLFFDYYDGKWYITEEEFILFGTNDYYVRTLNSGFSSISQFEVSLLIPSIFVNDSFKWVFSTDNEQLIHYDYNWDYTGSNWDTNIDELVFESIATDGYYYYVLESTYEYVHKFDLNWVYLNEFYLLESQDTNPKGIYYYNNYWYMVGDQNNKVYKYTSNWVYTGTSYDIGSYDGSPTGIYYYNSYWYVVGDQNNRVYKFDTSFAFQQYFSVGSQDTSPQHVYYNNGYWYVVGDQTNCVYKYDSSFIYTDDYYSISSEDTSPKDMFFHEHYWYIIGDQNDNIYKYFGIDLFDNIYVENFTYQVLGFNYNETYQLIFDSSKSLKDGMNNNGTLYYYFDSTFFSQYAYVNDVKILQQNLSVVFDTIYDKSQINFTMRVDYSTNVWKVPTEVDMSINDDDIVDESYNSGYNYLDDFPNVLDIYANLDVYFELNITIYFTFTFSLDIVSKTYLRKDFELLSDHNIYIDQIVFDDNIKLKKIYLNNIDLGSLNPTSLSPSKLMNTGNIFNLEVILSEELYRELPEDNYNLIFSELFGTQTAYMSHSYYPDDHSALYSVASQLYMYNEYPSELTTEDFSSWNLDSDSEYTDSAYSNGDFSSFLKNSSSTAYPYFYNIGSGYQNMDGTMLSVDSDYAKFLSQTEGIFGGEYNFALEKIGDKGVSEIEFIDQDSSSISEIISEIDGHNKILNISSYGSIMHYLTSQSTETIEFWWRTNVNNIAQNLMIGDGGEANSIYILFNSDGNVYYYYGSFSLSSAISSYSVDQWYHFKIEYDCTSDWHLYINGVSIDGGSGYNYVGSPTNMDIMRFQTRDGAEMYIDAFDSSSASDYISGRSKEPIMYFGNYPATYSFDDDEIWTDPDNWVITEGAGTNVEVVYEYLNHRKILNLSDDNSGSGFNFYNNFGQQIISGTIELWMLNTKTDEPIYIYLQGQSTTVWWRFESNGKIRVYNGVSNTDLCDYNADQWYHFRIDFDCSTNSFDMYINGVLEADDFSFRYDSSYVNSLKFYDGSGSGCNVYVDSIGYSWDPNYNLGDNYYFQYFQGSYDFEQYNLSSDPNYYGSYDFENYELYNTYLEYYANYLSGNYTTTTTPYGYYYGTESFLDWYAGGHYPATYSFLGEVGEEDDSISYVDFINSELSAEVISEYNDHSDVLEITYVDTYVGWKSIYNSFGEQKTHGIIELWISSNTSEFFTITGVGATWNDGFYLGFQNGNLFYYDGASFINIQSSAYVVDDWIHVSIDFNCVNHTFDAIINGIEYSSLPFSGSGDYVDKLYHQVADTNQHVCIDAVGYSWNDDYYEGMNHFDYYDGFYYGTHDFWNYSTPEDHYYGYFNNTEIGYYADEVYDVDYYYNNTDTYSQVVPEIDGHDSVLVMSDDSEVYRTQVWFDVNLEANHVIEFWFGVSNTSHNREIRLQIFEDTTNCIWLYWKSDYFGMFNGSYNTVKADFLVEGELNHYRIELDDANNEMDIYIDGVLEAENYQYYNPTTTGIDRLKFMTHDIGYLIDVYLDAVGIVGEDNYDNWRNWQGYDLTPILNLFSGNLNNMFNCSMRIIDSIGGHNQVLEIYDNHVDSAISGVIPFTEDMSNGTFEFWYMSPDATDRFQFQTWYSGSIAFQFRINSDYWYWYDGSSWILIENVPDPQDNVWYHIQVNFDTSSFDGQYMGLASNEYEIVINGVSSGALGFQTDVSYLSSFRMLTRTTVPDSIHYIDAISYSWDDWSHDGVGYVLGLNKNSYNLTEWDDNDWFYTGILGTNYSILDAYDLHYDVLRVIDESATGNYVGTYNFDYITALGFYYMGEDDFNKEDIGETSPVWITSDTSSSNCDYEIIEEFDGHKNVLEINDQNNTGLSSLYHSYGSIVEDRIVEFWWANDGTQYAYFYLYEVDSLKFRIRLDPNGDLPFYNGTTSNWQDLTNGLPTNVFYHIKLECDDSADTVDVYLNGVLIGNDLDYENPSTTGVDNVKIGTSSPSVGKVYYDAIATTDDSFYSEGYNINPYDINPLLNEDFITVFAFSGSYIRINPIVGDHFNVLEVFDNQTNIDYGDTLLVRKVWGTYEVSGTVEFWLRTDDATYEAQIAMQGGTTFYLRVQDDKFSYYNGSWNDVGLSALDNTWYHIRIDFECGSGGYNGLSADTWKLYINGVEYGIYNFVNDKDYLSYLLFSSDANHYGYSFYIDGFGYSWDSNYISGYNEWSIGSQLWHNFTEQTTNRGFSYWIHGNDNWRMWILNETNYILGIKCEDTYLFYHNGNQWVNTTTTLQDRWNHFVIYLQTSNYQYDLLVNDEEYTSLDIQLDYLISFSKILFETESNTTSSYYIDALILQWETDGGWYRNLIDNCNPYGIIEDMENDYLDIDIIYQAYCEASVNEFSLPHGDVLNITDNTTNGNIEVFFYFDAYSSSGNIDFWITSDSFGDPLYFYLYNQYGGWSNTWKIDDDQVYYWSGSYVSAYSGLIDMTWVHISINFDCGTDTYDLYVNGNQVLDDQAFTYNTDDVDYIRFYTDRSVSGYSYYLNALGYSWNPYYNHFDNCNLYGLLEEVEDDNVVFNYRPNCSVSLVDFGDDHNQVLNFTDNNDGDAGISLTYYPYLSFGDEDVGNYELWIRTTDATSTWVLCISGDVGNAMRFRIYNDKYYYYDGGWVEISGLTPSDNEWIHINFDFDCSTDKWYLYINGDEFGEYDFEKDNSVIRYIEMWDSVSDYGVSWYLDAIGITSDSNYEEGYNTNPYYESLLTTGVLTDFNIVYDYESYIFIDGEYNGNKKILRMFDNSTNTLSKFNHYFTAQESGTIEFYIKTTDAESQSYFTPSGAFRFQIYQDKFQYYDTIWNDVGLSALDNTWYHIRMDFECGSGGYNGLSADTWKLYINGVEYGTYNFETVKTNIDYIQLRTSNLNSNYSYFVDAISYSWEHDIGTNFKCDQRMELNFTSGIELTGYYNNDTVDALMMYYAYITDVYQDIEFYVYNFNILSWTLINCSANNETFYLLNYNLDWSDYVNSTNNMLLMFYGYNNTNDFELYVDALYVWYNWTKTSGDVYAQISKNVATSFLNRYDSFDDYLKIYSINLEFTYQWTKYQTLYNDYADITYNGTNILLTKDGNPQVFDVFINYNSGNWDEFNIEFNISNGLLELSSMTYEILFECVDVNNDTKMYQKFVLDCNLNLADYEQRYLDFVLNFTINSFVQADDFSDLTSDTDYSSMKYLINITTESGQLYSDFSSNSSIISQTIMIDLRNILESNNKYYLKNLELTFFVAGNSSFLSLDNVYIYTSGQSSIQKTINPSTDVDSVEFEEYFEADRSFKYWYIENDLTINDIELENIDRGTTITTFELENYKYYFEDSALIYDDYVGVIDYNLNWQVDFSYVLNNKTDVLIEIEYSADKLIYNVSMVVDLRGSNIFLDPENEDRSEYVLTVDNMNFTTSTQSIIISGTRVQKTIEPRTNLNTTQLTETFVFDSQSFTSTVEVDPTWFIDFDVVENNGTYTKLKVYKTAGYELNNVDLILNLLNEEIFNENWTLNATQSIVTYKLTIPDVSFTTEITEFYIEGNSSVPETYLDDFINEDGFSLDEDNYKDLDEWIYGYMDFSKYSKAWIISDIEQYGDVDGVHYGLNYYDVTSVGYFLSDGFGTGISDVYLRFKSNPVNGFDREVNGLMITYTIDMKYECEEVDLEFYIESSERYSKSETIKAIKDYLDEHDYNYLDIIQTVSADFDQDGIVEDYYTIVEIDLNSGENKIVINIVEENVVSSVFWLLIAGIAIFGFYYTYMTIKKKGTKKFKFLNNLKIWKKGVLMSFIKQVFPKRKSKSKKQKKTQKKSRGKYL